MRVQPYQEYRESGVEWLGRVPAHWNVHRFKLSIASCQNGVWGDDPAGDHNDIVCIRVADFDRLGFRTNLRNPTIRSVSARDREMRAVRNGDLLIEKSGGGERQPVGAVVAYKDDQPAVCSNFVARMQMAAGMDPQFWCYMHAAAYAVRLTSQSVKQTSGIQNLDQGAYFDERAAFPPSTEQSAIAAFLDRETGKIDALVAEQERLIALLKEKRQAVISHAVTKGLNPNAPMKDSGVPWLGEVPEHWEIRSLGSLARKGTTITYGIVQAGPDYEDGIPYIRTSDMSGVELPKTGYLRTSLDIDQAYSRSKVETGDLVIAIRATVGKTLPVPSYLHGANLTQGTARFATSSTVNVSYMRLFLNSSGATQGFEALAKGATFKEITLDMLRKFRAPVPPLSEQNEIVSASSDRDAAFASLILEATRAITLLRERRAALISAAVTGKIDVRDTVAQLSSRAA